jgi:protein-L-isoaspartate(D-aspartate) O-methyltransferase
VTASTDPGGRRRALVEELTARGVLTRPWREAFLTVSRHAFIPDTVWCEDTDGPQYLAPVRRADDPEDWLDRAYGDASVVTQVDDGHPVGPGQGGRLITSSASMPGIMAIMLDVLDVQPGMRVLEIGTGTGYNAALLAHRLGADHVTTVEIDPVIAGQARRSLRRAGLSAVEVIVGDGSAGHPAGAPFDRVLSTAACHRVPYAWVAQTRPGGRIITPWRSDFYHCALLSLAVGEEGSAIGRIVGKAAFMDLRDQRVRRVSFADIEHQDRAVERTTHLHPYEITGDHDAATAIGIRVPRVRHIYQPPDAGSGEAVLWLIDPWSSSWASLHDPRRPVDSYRVRAHGPRDVWAEVQAAHDWWTANGRPRADRWRFTISADAQRIDLDAEPSDPQ